MFRFVSLLTTILACTQYALGSNLHSALHGPTASIISSGYGGGYYGNHGGHPALANSVISSNHHGVPAHNSVISSYSSTVVHPNSVISHPFLRSNSIPYGGHIQHISAPSSLTNHINSSPLVSGGAYLGHSESHGHSYAIQRSYTGPLAGSGLSVHGIISGPNAVSGGYGAQLGQNQHGEYSGHPSRW
ncbi:uncharacterized protein LOC129947861 [Eupeodes corollae]|uniref:uncharacterized protein LOC129947861 n=1 Tax=Eupeodes corollae TaxID=290404 RepID=UPI0024907BB8|nr:uncharacterized protein LOC129947861 [Eupeodes corollae]